MTEREQLELKIELARAYEHEAERLVRQEMPAVDGDKAQRYLKLSHEMVALLESVRPDSDE